MNTILFFDDYMLRDYTGVRRRFFGAEKIHEILPDHPAEVGGRILYNPSEGAYRLWRRVLHMDSDKIVEMKVYESRDLRRWTELADCGLPPESPILAGFITRDDFEPDPAKRYKCTYIERNKDNTGHGAIAVSDDGLHWTIDGSRHFCEHISDTANNTFYNPIFGEYQTILRGGFIDRRIFCITSRDLIYWNKARCLMMPGPDDEPCTEYYGMIVFPQDGYFLGYLWKYLPPLYDTPKNKMAGKTDTHLVYSYDGYCWHFAGSRPVAERPLPPEHGSTGIYLTSLDPSIDGQSWILSGDLRRVDHACGFKPAYPDTELPPLAQQQGFAATGVYKVRREGFAALESNSNQAHITLKRIVLQGESLFFNLCAPMGRVRFQIRDGGDVIPGFSFEECVPFACDDQIRFKPSWKTRDIGELRGRSITIEIQMYMALIFSITGDFYNHTGYHPMRSLGDTDRPEYS